MPGGTHPPLSVIASWPTPNYVDPEHRGWGLVILSVSLAVFMLAVVAMRLFARLGIQGTAGLDDLCIVVSAVIAVGLVIAVGYASKACGFDLHVWDLREETRIRSRKVTMAIECLYVATTTLTRVSILLFHRRLGERAVSTAFVYCVKMFIVFNIAYFVVFEVTLFAGCRPFSAFWNQVIPTWVRSHEYICLNEATNLYAASFLSVFLDFAVCLLPMALFWKLQMPRRQKQALGFLFGVGGFLCICGIMRIRWIHAVFYENYDTTWTAYNAWMWTVTEVLLAIPCASAPALRIFFKKYPDVPGFLYTLLQWMLFFPRWALNIMVIIFHKLKSIETLQSKTRSDIEMQSRDVSQIDPLRSKSTKRQDKIEPEHRRSHPSSEDDIDSNDFPVPPNTPVPASLRFGNERPLFWEFIMQTSTIETQRESHRESRGHNTRSSSARNKASRSRSPFARETMGQAKKRAIRPDALKSFEYETISSRNKRSRHEHELERARAIEEELRMQVTPLSEGSQSARNWLLQDPFSSGNGSHRSQQRSRAASESVSRPSPRCDALSTS